MHSIDAVQAVDRRVQLASTYDNFACNACGSEDIDPDEFEVRANSMSSYCPTHCALWLFLFK
jgi:predicted RNA-binding Zn-ribbon protein involved in translation (DUF1610 family)